MAMGHTESFERKGRTEEISLKDLFLKLKQTYVYLLSKWVIILIVGLSGGAIGFLCAILIKPVYTATYTFVLEDNGGGASALGQYAGLASMVGIDLDGGGGGLFQGENLLQLYRSRTMIEKTLLSYSKFNGKDQMLARRFIEFNELQKVWEAKVGAQNLIFADSSNFTIKQDSIISVMVKMINTKYLSVSKPDKKLNIIKVEMRSKDELFAKAFCELIVGNVNRFYVDTKVKKSRDNLNILQHQTDSIRRSLNSAISGVASMIDVNPNANPARQILRVPAQKRQIDAEANKAILTELVKNLEISKISLRKETPLIQTIDYPVLPLEKSKVGKAIGIVAGGIIGGILAISFLLVRRLFRNVLK